MDTLEQAVEKLEALGFELDKAGKDLYTFATKSNQPYSCRLIGRFDPKTGNYFLWVSSRSHTKERIMFETELLTAACSQVKLPDTDLSSIVDTVKTQLDVPEGISIGELVVTYEYNPNLTIEGQNLEEIHSKLVGFAERIGYKISRSISQST